MELEHITTVKVLDLDVGDIPHGLGEFIGVLARALGEIPPEYRGTATVDIEPTWAYDESYPHLSVEYYRPETEDEAKARVAAAEGHQQQQIEEARRRLFQLAGKSAWL